MGKTQKDIFANVAHIEVVESGLNTLTFQKLETGVSLFEKMAWIIHAIDYYIDWETIAASADRIDMAITTSDQISEISLDQAAVIDMLSVYLKEYGTGATMATYIRPIRRFFNDLPGGGVIVPPNPVYLAVKGTAMPAAATIACRIWYTQRALKAEEFWELVEARRIISSS